MKNALDSHSQQDLLHSTSEGDVNSKSNSNVKLASMTAALGAISACSSGETKPNTVTPQTTAPEPVSPEPTTPEPTTPEPTNPVEPRMATQGQAARFLMQTTLGADESLIKKVADMGLTTWLNEQLEQELDSNNPYQNKTNTIWQEFRQKLSFAYGEPAINGDGNNPALAYKWYFHMAWWQQNLTEQTHLLRQRIALALSELLVISDNSALELDAVGMASYYDLLYKHAFGNYNDLLYEVSTHPCMGVYLSHMNNQKAKPSENIHPDENYAREIMQLFTIGLFELNEDGTRKTDASGKDIPTYNNNDIREMARIFTGLKAAEYRFEWETSFWPKGLNGSSVSFNDGVDKAYKTVPYVSMTKPMVMEQAFHDTGAKSLLGGKIEIDANQPGLTEIKSAVSQLVTHPNTAPFVAKHLIQQLVTANPSTRYVKAVASKFGRTGNLKAMIREIFTYPLNDLPAKTRFSSAKVVNGKLVQSQLLKSPVLRMTQLLRAFNVKNQSNKLWLIGDDIAEALEQHPLSSPTVFNFYQNDFTPLGELDKKELVGPRFQLHNAATSIAYVNQMYYALFGDFLPAVSTRINLSAQIKNVPELDPRALNQIDSDRLSLDFNNYKEQASDASQHDALIDRLSLLLTGDAPPPNKSAIKEAFSTYANNPDWVLQTIVFFIVISPNYIVLAA